MEKPEDSEKTRGKDEERVATAAAETFVLWRQVREFDITIPIPQSGSLSLSISRWAPASASTFSP